MQVLRKKMIALTYVVSAAAPELVAEVRFFRRVIRTHPPSCGMASSKVLQEVAEVVCTVVEFEPILNTGRDPGSNGCVVARSTNSARDQ